MNKIKIGLIGDYNPDVTAHKAIPPALNLSALKSRCQIEYQWLETESINKKYIKKINSFQGFCNYGFNHDYLEMLKKSDMKISGYDSNHEVRIVELKNHLFFVATLFQPERSSLENKNHPLIDAFTSAAMGKY